MDCFQKVFGTLDGTARWRGLRPCKGKVVGYVVKPDGTAGIHFCRRHEKDVKGLKVEKLTNR